jgi:hypothetical protein
VEELSLRDFRCATKILHWEFQCPIKDKLSASQAKRVNMTKFPLESLLQAEKQITKRKEKKDERKF